MALDFRPRSIRMVLFQYPVQKVEMIEYFLLGRQPNGFCRFISDPFELLDGLGCDGAYLLDRHA